MSLQLRIGGEAAADQRLPLGFVSHSVERREENLAPTLFFRDDLCHCAR
jgi:hypothetical protein